MLEDVSEVINEYFACTFTEETDLEGSKISVENINMLGQFEIKKQMVLRHLKSIKLDKSSGSARIY